MIARKTTAHKILAMFKLLHQAIVTAKLRRLRRELTLHRSTSAEFDAAQFPQHPLMLGDKWDL